MHSWYKGLLQVQENRRAGDALTYDFAVDVKRRGGVRLQCRKERKSVQQLPGDIT